MKRILNLFRKTNESEKDKIDTRDAFNLKIQESQKRLNEAAKSTLLMAEDVTSALRDKIDDYVKHINGVSDILSDALIVVTQRGIIENFNSAAEHMFEINSNKVMGKSIHTLFCKPDGSYISLEEFQEIMEFDNPTVIEKINTNPAEEDIRGKTSNGRIFWVDANISCFRKVDGSARYILLVRDVTERIENEMKLIELMEYNSKLINVINKSDVGILITDPKQDGTPIIFVNKGFCTMLGYSREEILGRDPKFINFVDREDSGWKTLRHASKYKIPTTVEMKVYRKDGSQMWFEVYLTPIFKEGKIDYWISIQHDITQKKLLSAKQEGIFSAIPDLVITANSKHVVTSCSVPDKFANIFRTNQLVQKTIADFFPTEAHIIMGHWDRVLLNGNPESIVVNFFYNEEEHFWEIRSVKCEEEILSIFRDITEIRDQQAESLSQAAFITSLFDATTIGICICGESGSFQETNVAFSTITGYSQEELKRMTAFDLLYDRSDVKKAANYIRAIFNEEDSNYNTEWILKVKDGTKKIVQMSVRMFHNRRGVRAGVFTIQDVTGLRILYDELQESETRFRIFGEASHDMMLVHNDKNILDFSNRLAALTGYLPEELKILNPYTLIHPLEREKIRNRVLFRDSSVEEDEFETLLTTKTNETIEVKMVTKVIIWKGIKAKIVIVSDITKYKNVEEMLRNSREKYNTVLDNTVDLVFSFDASMNITFSNNTFRDYFNLSTIDLIGKNIVDFIHDNDRKAFLDQVKFLDIENNICRFMIRITNDEDRRLDVMVRLIMEPDGKVSEYQVVARDITAYLKKPAEIIKL